MLPGVLSVAVDTKTPLSPSLAEEALRDDLHAKRITFSTEVEEGSLRYYVASIEMSDKSDLVELRLPPVPERSSENDTVLVPALFTREQLGTDINIGESVRALLVEAARSSNPQPR